MGALQLEVVMETNRTEGSEYPGRIRQADRWVAAHLRIRGQELTLRADREGTWRLEAPVPGRGTQIISGTVGKQSFSADLVVSEGERVLPVR